MNLREEKTLLVANPAAQRGNGLKAAHIAHDLLVEWLGEGNVDMVLTERSGHACEIVAESPRSRYGTVIALGGDGIVHEAINGIMGLQAEDRPRFGLVPVGSGNDYARTLGMSQVVPDAIVQFLNAPEVAMDVGACNGEFFAETLSFGLDAAIALDTMERRKRTGEQGTILYAKSGIGQLLHHLESFQMQLSLDRQRTAETAVHLLTVQIGPTYGGGFRICPEADPTDGLFDICYAEAPMSVPEATFKFLSAKNAHHTKFKHICFERASELKLSFDRRPPCQIDGEPHIADEYHVVMNRQAVRVLAPSFAGK